MKIKQRNIILIGIIIVFIIVQYMTVKDMVSLPSPIYGGDLYYQLGQTNNVKYNGNPLESANTKGSLPIYFVVYSLITGNIAKLLNIDAFMAELLFSRC